MPAPIKLTSLQFSDGTTVEVDGGSVAVLVGPNNSGKSRGLRDIYEALWQPQQGLAVVLHLGIDREADIDAVKTWLREHANAFQRGLVEFVVKPSAGEIRMDTIDVRLPSGPPFFEIAPFVALLANTESRLGLAGSSGAIDLLEQRPSTPLQQLATNEDLERQLSGAAERAFGRGIVVNRVSGGTIHLHIGSLEPIEGQPTTANPAYIEAFRQLPRVELEGDGVRSYIGLLLTMTAAQYPLVLVDEPEAFLHPPQARQLGRELASLLTEDTQVVVATHSSHFLQGVLDDPNKPVTVIRLTREGNINKAAVLRPDRLRELWRDPILRYSALLDGLFHDGVVLCESDSDCRFYQATLDANQEDQHGPDLLFTHTGGKERLPTAIRALRAIKVDVQVVADFDVLNSKRLLKKIVEELGGNWADVDSDWNAVAGAAGNLGAAPPMTAVRDEVAKALDAEDGATLTRESAERLRRPFKIEDGWARLKRGGIAVLPQGEESQRAERLVSTLDALGLHVVSVGELERWAPGIAGHGPAWVAAALEARIHEQDGPHVRFVKKLIDA